MVFPGESYSSSSSGRGEVDVLGIHLPINHCTSKNKSSTKQQKYLFIPRELIIGIDSKEEEDDDYDVLTVGDIRTSAEGKHSTSSSCQFLKYNDFKIFDAAEDYSDHHYWIYNSYPNQKFAKGIQEEWKILEKHLLDEIFVRIYASKMDLLRAVIVGAEGTPYHESIGLPLPKTFGTYVDSKVSQQFGDGSEYAWGFKRFCTWIVFGYYNHYSHKDIQLFKCLMLE